MASKSGWQVNQLPWRMEDGNEVKARVVRYYAGLCGVQQQCRRGGVVVPAMIILFASSLIDTLVDLQGR